MGEGMKEYKYLSNKDANDGTELIRLEGRDESVSQGGTVKLTEKEHELLKERFNLRAVDSDPEEQGETSTEGEDDSSSSK